MAESKLRNDKSALLPTSTLAAPLRLNGKADRQLFESRPTKICSLISRIMFRMTPCVCARGTTLQRKQRSRARAQAAIRTRGLVVEAFVPNGLVLSCCRKHLYIRRGPTLCVTRFITSNEATLGHSNLELVRGARIRRNVCLD